MTQVTKAGRAKAVKAVRLRAAYIPARNAVKLTLSGKPRFTAGGQLRLVAIAPSGIASSSGVYLEGNMGNQSGADGALHDLARRTGNCRLISSPRTGGAVHL